MLRSLVGSEMCIRDRWKTDISLESICVVLPRNTEQVSEIMKICYENDQEVVIHGGLTNLVGATKSNSSQVVISLEKMNKIIEIDTDSKTITCESGVILEDLINACKENDLLLPLNFGARGCLLYTSPGPRDS